MSRPPNLMAVDDYRALAAFRRWLRVFLRFSEEAARNAGITPAQHQLLLAVKGHPSDSPPSIGEIAEALQVKHHSVVELIDRAEDAGLVWRELDPADRRRHLVGLTPAGAETLAALSVAHRDELRRFRTELAAVLHDLS